MKVLLLSAIPGAAALGLWALLDLENFLLFAVLGATIFPASLGHVGGSNIAAVDVLLVVAIVAWIITNSLRRAPDPAVRGNPLVLPALLFTLWNTVSIAWSIHASKTLAFSIQLAELTIVFPLAFATLPSSLDRLRRALFWLIGLTCVLAIWALAAVAHNPSVKTAAEFLPGYNKNALGAFLATGLVLAYALFIGARRSGQRKLLLLSMVITAGGLTASNSRGAMVGAGAGLLAVGLLLNYRKYLAIVLAAALGVGYFTVAQPAHNALAGKSGGYDSSTVRHWAWIDGWHKVKANPWFGTGGRTYVDTLPQVDNLVIVDPDNLLLLTWAELGIPGVLLIGYLVFAFLALLWRLRRLPREIAALAVGAGGVAIAALVHFQVDVSWSRGETTVEFVMMGVMLAVARLAAQEQVAAGEPLEPADVVPVDAPADAFVLTSGGVG
jgi:O-antigen ligase